jgi:hypothetical protein
MILFNTPSARRGNLTNTNIKNVYALGYDIPTGLRESFFVEVFTYADQKVRENLGDIKFSEVIFDTNYSDAYHNYLLKIKSVFHIKELHIYDIINPEIINLGILKEFLEKEDIQKKYISGPKTFNVDDNNIVSAINLKLFEFIENYSDTKFDFLKGAI